jgi:signal transduction histidine kinase
MKIRTRLTLQFLLIGGVILILSSTAIYIASAGFRRDNFYNRLEIKANIIANLLVDVEEIDATMLRQIELENPTQLNNERIIIFDYNDNLIYSTDEEFEIYINKSFVDRVRLEGNVRKKQKQFEVLGLLYTGRFDRFVVVAAAVDVFGHLKMKNLIIILSVVCFLSLVLFSLAGWFYSGKSLQPIKNVIQQVEEISISSLNLRVDEGNGSDEIAILAKTFNRMLDRLEDAFQTQKDFISNASHELRTPLTAINGQLEVLLLKDRSNDDYRRVSESVLEDIRNIINLSNRLLLLAQTSSELELPNENVRLDEMIWQASEDLKNRNPNYLINFTMDNSFTEAEQLIIKGDSFLLRTAISNIIENACKYSNDHAAEIKLEVLSDHLLVRFIDKGIGIPTEDLSLIFEPFHRGKNVKTVEGYGIGLSLSQRIIKKHRGKIIIASAICEGTEVVIQFPPNS